MRYLRLDIKWKVLVGACLVSCTHAPVDTTAAKVPGHVVIKPFTEITDPKLIGEPNTGGLPEDSVTVPKSLLLISRFKKNHIELREGPGALYPIKDRLMDRGEKVILFDRLGQWRKVHALRDGAKGWVHAQFLSPMERSKMDISLRAKDLPLLMTITAVKKIYSYPEEKEIEVTIPKGASFAYFKKTPQKVLVWLQSTHSVAWMARKELQ